MPRLNDNLDAFHCFWVVFTLGSPSRAPWVSLIPLQGPVIPCILDTYFLSSAVILRHISSFVADIINNGMWWEIKDWVFLVARMINVAINSLTTHCYVSFDRASIVRLEEIIKHQLVLSRVNIHSNIPVILFYYRYNYIWLAVHFNSAHIATWILHHGNIKPFSQDN